MQACNKIIEEIFASVKQYHHDELADQVAGSILNLLSDDMSQTGCFHEYYSPETGKPIATPGFMSWNALAGLF